MRSYRARYYDLMDWLGDDLKPYYLHYQDYGKKEGLLPPDPLQQARLRQRVRL